MKINRVGTREGQGQACDEIGGTPYSAVASVRGGGALPCGGVAKTAFKKASMSSRSPVDSIVALPLATFRILFSIGQMSLCGKQKLTASASPIHDIFWCSTLQYLFHPHKHRCQP